MIVQNFVPKPDTVMRNEPACPKDDLLRTIAMARLILPPDVHLQAPPTCRKTSVRCSMRGSTTSVVCPL